MGFFKVPDPPEEIEDDELDEDHEPLPRWIGGVVPVELVAVRTEEVALVLSRVVAYPDGFEFALTSYIRRPRRRQWPHRPPRGWYGEPPSDEEVRVGLLWSDGGRATTLDHWGEPFLPDMTEPAHGLRSSGGSGSDDEFISNFYGWPIPSDGLQLVLEWPEYGVEDTFVDLPAEEIAAAAARSEPVWEEDRDRLPGRSPFFRHGALTGAFTIDEVDEGAAEVDDNDA